MRLMAGLDVPTAGSVWFDGKDVTGVPVQQRAVAMVYQQFINYPSLTVYENIASPLRVAGAPTGRDRPRGAASRRADEADALSRAQAARASGGQQQRTALARAIVKNADLVLLDEPLANLDYKLREELREELPRIFAATGAIFVYATTEPLEALLLGGYTATLSEGPRHAVRPDGRGLPQAERPGDGADLLRSADQHARAAQEGRRASCSMAGVNLPVPAELAGIADGSYTIGFRPHHLSLQRPSAGRGRRSPAKVAVTEITGSESFVHLDFAGERWVVLAHGVHDLRAGRAGRGLLDPRHFFVFDAPARSAAAPGASGRRRRRRWRASFSTTSRHAYGPNPKAAAGLRAEASSHHVWEDGGAYALLGPSGCGKTTLLNIISGLITPSEGRVLFDGTDVTELSDRGAQHRAGVPVPGHLRHHDGRREPRLPAAQPRRAGGRGRPKRVARSPQMLDLADAGRTQGARADRRRRSRRSRSAAAWCAPDVNAILFDEPLTVIDPHLKWELRSQLKAAAPRSFDLTMVYVTHDQTEALTFADKVVVMYEGEVVQIGTPEDLFERPAHTFVGYFIGSPGMNVLPVERRRRPRAARRRRRSSSPRAYRGLPAARRSSSASGRNSSGSAATARHAGQRRQGRRHRPPQGRARRASTATTSTSIAGEDARRSPAEPQRRLRSGRHPHLRRRPGVVEPEGAAAMDKTWNNRAWFMVLPVLILVAFNAIIPLMTVVNYSVQETFGDNVFFFEGVEWFQDVLHSRALPRGAAAAAHLHRHHPR